MRIIESGCKLDAAARYIRMLGLGGNDRGGRNFLRRLAYRHAVGGHQARGNRGLGAGAAFEQAARDQQAICTFSGVHVFAARPRASGDPEAGFPPTRE